MSGLHPAARTWAVATLLVALAVPVQAGEEGGILGLEARDHLRTALRCLNMSEADMGFAKDHGKPRLALERTRRILAEPLLLPETADAVLDGVQKGEPSALWRLAGQMLETEIRNEPPAGDTPDASGVTNLAPDVAIAVASFVREAQRAEEMVERALAALSPDERSYLAAVALGGLFDAEAHADVRDGLVAIGVSSQHVTEVIAEALALDPEPAARRYLDLVQKIDRPYLLAGGRVLQAAATVLRRAVTGAEVWPASPVLIEEGGIRFWIGTLGDDIYAEPAALILDPAGADIYRGGAGAANGLLGSKVSAVVDLAGDDRYEGAGLLGAGAALMGAAVIADASGNDSYAASYAGQAAAIYGVAWLEDLGGDDAYRARGFAQGAARVGLAVLDDHAGDDTYEAGFYGQAFAELLGFGLLVDRAGNDRYFAGGVEPDHERHQDRFISLSQGFAIGMRPFAGGGVAALVDLDGNDTYVADVYGQGASYWYAVGLLLDVAGNDTYSVCHYGQGSGIHLSSGLLYDGAGNDTYTGQILAQGNGHDYAVGMLFDASGDDTYTALRDSQGRAMNTALAVLLDAQGNDSYFGREADLCQGVGNEAGQREYGSLALLLDLAGEDRYTCGAADGARMLRPWFGMVYDVEGARK